jgi:cell wall assembly regulator SMI1
MDEVVARLATWLETHDPERLQAFGPGASEEAIAAAEKEVGVAFPAGMKALYRWHDGTARPLLGNRVLMSLADIVKTRQMMNKAVDDGAFKTSNWYRKTWVPFMSNLAGDHLVWDPRGSFSGEPGQVLEFWHTDHDRKVLAPSFDGWLTSIVESLEAGNWRVDSDEGITDDHSFGEFLSSKFPGFPKLAIDADGKRPKRPPPPPPRVDADPSREVKTYSIKERYAVGDRVQHPQFGLGVVQRSEEAKCDVLFEGGLRALIQGKGGSGLEKPKPFDHTGKGARRV